jgi:hypothetical protein
LQINPGFAAPDPGALIFPAFTTWIGAEKALLEQKRVPTAGERSGGPRRWVAASTPGVAAQSESTGMCAP